MSSVTTYLNYIEAWKVLPVRRWNGDWVMGRDHIILKPGEATKALCRKKLYKNPLASCTGRGPAPHENGHCGLYGVESPQYMVKLIDGWERDGNLCRKGHVVVKVALWGKVIVHEKGWRAQYCSPLSIAGAFCTRCAEFLEGDCEWCGPHFKHSRIISALARRYSIPVAGFAQFAVAVNGVLARDGRMAQYVPPPPPPPPPPPKPRVIHKGPRLPSKFHACAICAQAASEATVSKACGEIWLCWKCASAWFTDKTEEWREEWVKRHHKGLKDKVVVLGPSSQRPS